MPDELLQLPAVDGHLPPLRAGARVYCVSEVDLPPDNSGPHTWNVDFCIVERASAKQIKLQHPFRGTARVLFDPTALGRFFFTTPQQAIQDFLATQRTKIASLDRKKKEAERAIAWAEDLVHKSVAP